MWTAKITGKNFKNGELIVNVEYTNGVDTLYKAHVGINTFESLKNTVRSTINDLNMREMLADAITDGIVDTTAPQPTQLEANRDGWLKDYNKWCSIKRNLVDTGILTGDEDQLQTLKTKVQTNFNPGYLDYI